MRRIVWIIPLVVLAGCARKEATVNNAANGVTTSAPGAADVASLRAEKARIIVALQKAHSTLPSFVRALKKPKPSQSQFAVKAAVSDGKSTQHVWLNDVTFDGKKFRGVLGNRVSGMKSARLGDKAEVAPDGVSDWMYVENHKLIGGYTMRALRDGLSPQERKDFDKSLPFTVD